MSRIFTAILIIPLVGVICGNLTPPTPLPMNGEGGVQPAPVVLSSPRPTGAENSTAPVGRGEEANRDHTLNTPSPFMERGTGGEVSKINRQGGQVLGGAKPAAPPPVAAKTVTLSTSGSLASVAGEITKQTGITLDLTAVDDKAKVDVKFNKTAAWDAIEAAADQANCFVSVIGDRVKLSRRPNGVGAVPSSIDGPFRVVLKRVVAKRDPERADAEYEFHLEVQWEPRFPVYLIDTEPKATATAGKKVLTADSASVQVMPTGYSHPAVVVLKNVPRDAKQFDELVGSFRVVAAAKMLAVEFKDLTGDKPVSQTVEGVTVTLHPAKKLEKRVEFMVEMEYPDTHPKFESNHLWHAANTFRLFGPNDRTGMKPSDMNLSDGERRRPSAEYTYTGPNGGAFTVSDLKGWRVVYETPAPMSEQTVKFKLKGVVLP